jgi:RNA polymerase sigma factor (sigma-70 family)
MRTYAWATTVHTEMASIAPEISIVARDEAFEALYRRYVKDVYHYALALLRNPADAEDVTQTTFMNAYRAFSRGEEIEKPQNWLIKIAHNVARTRYARSSRVKEVPLEDHVDQLAVPEEERPNVAGVLSALGRLPFNQRAALVMRELEGRSYSEIADTLGVSVAAVETLIFRARRSLRVRASALRSLGAVPLPGSLAQLFGGGSVVAGGGALFGTGFIVKATVALLAGVVVTGLGGEQAHRAVATPRAHVVAVPGRTPTVDAVAGGPAANLKRGVTARVAARALIGSPGVRGADAGAPQALPQGSATGGSTPPGASPPAQAAAPSPTAPVENVVDTVETTVSATVSTTVSALPVQLPSLPPLPVEPPPLPKLP